MESSGAIQRYLRHLGQSGRHHICESEAHPLDKEHRSNSIGNMLPSTHPGSIWCHLEPSLAIWSHLGQCETVWGHLVPSKAIWNSLLPRWGHLGLSGAIEFGRWGHLVPCEAIWTSVGRHPTSSRLWNSPGNKLKRPPALEK